MYLLDLILYALVNKFSVMLGSLPGLSFGVKSSTLPLSHCGPCYICVYDMTHITAPDSTKTDYLEILE